MLTELRRRAVICSDLIGFPGLLVGGVAGKSKKQFSHDRADCQQEIWIGNMNSHHPKSEAQVTIQP
jgi:hypothetical protein